MGSGHGQCDVHGYGSRFTVHGNSLTDIDSTQESEQWEITTAEIWAKVRRGSVKNARAGDDWSVQGYARCGRLLSFVERRGYGKDDVNVLMSDDTRKKYFSDTDGDTELGTKAWEDAGKGAAIGGGVGATLAAIAAIGTTLALPGLGLLIAGPLAAALAGGGAGALTGGLIGALVARHPEEQAKVYEKGFKDGGIVRV